MSDVLHTISELKEEKDFVLKVYTWVSSTGKLVFLNCMVDAFEDPFEIDELLRALTLCAEPKCAIADKLDYRFEIICLIQASVIFLRQEIRGTK